jgi:hypothetical protein
VSAPDDIALAAEATELAYKTQTVGNRFDELPGFVVDRVFDDFWRNTGFYAVGFSGPEQTIITIRGSEDRLDIISDADLGIPQYSRYRAPLIDYIGANLLGGHVTLTGHSLGGGVAQYLGYDAAREFSGFRQRLAVHTHNALGAVAGLIRLNGTYDAPALEGVAVRNYRHPLDVVSRIGGQAGGNVFNLAPGKKAVSALVAHSNDHFLPGRSPGALGRATLVEDQAFPLAQSLVELTPALALAAREVFTDGQLTIGAKRALRLVMQMPLEERKALGDAVSAFIPLKGTWNRLFRRRMMRVER